MSAQNGMSQLSSHLPSNLLPLSEIRLVLSGRGIYLVRRDYLYKRFSIYVNRYQEYLLVDWMVSLFRSLK